jgi:hypothetical protein
MAGELELYPVGTPTHLLGHDSGGLPMRVAMGDAGFVPAGTLLYVGSAVKTDTQTTPSTTPVDITGLSVTFTAKAATQYLYVFDGMVSASSTNFVSFLCDEAGTDVGLGAASSARSRVTRSCAPGVGGGYAGNEIEKRTHTVTVYQVGVRMDNGTLRSVETRSAPPIGKAVRLKGHTLSPADGHK